MGDEIDVDLPTAKTSKQCCHHSQWIPCHQPCYVYYWRQARLFSPYSTQSVVLFCHLYVVCPVLAWHATPDGGI